MVQKPGAGHDKYTLNKNLVLLSDETFNALLEKMRRYRLLHYSPETSHYSAHPLIRHYYYNLLWQQPFQAQITHRLIANYYLSFKEDISEKPNLDELLPLLEAAHHACQASDYDDAYCIREFIDEGENCRLTYELTAYETALSMSLDFFPDNDITKKPLLTNSASQLWIMNRVGFCYLNLGQLQKAADIFEVKNEFAKSQENWESATFGLNNLADVYIFLGRIQDSLRVAKEAIELAPYSTGKNAAYSSLYREARAIHLLGDISTASEKFKHVHFLEQEEEFKYLYIYCKRNLYYVEHLLQIKDTNLAEVILNQNLQRCITGNWSKLICQCYRLLGDLNVIKGELQQAGIAYEEAIKIARSLSDRAILIEGLSARGGYKININDITSALEDLTEALHYSINDEYLIYEVDIRINLAWANLGIGNISKAQQEISRAFAISNDIEYYWGKLGCKDVFAYLSK